MQIFLEVRFGRNAASRLVMHSARPVRLGRTSKADHVFPDDQQMSSLHFSIEPSEKGYILRDLNSRNGTFLNGARVSKATLANGDEIRAGNTRFVFRIQHAEPVGTDEGKPVGSAQPPGTSATPPEIVNRASAASTAPPPASPPKSAGPPPSPQTPQGRLHALLSREFQPLYALLDAACEPSVLKVIYESKEEYQSLFDGPQGAQLAHFAPYLIRIPPQSPLIDTLIKQAWAKNWGVFLTCDKSIKDLRTHFRQFLVVKLPNGKQVYFRFYDPAVLRLFLPTCLPKEADEFFGPVQHFLMEDEDPKSALHFHRDRKGVAKKPVALAAA